MPFCRWCGNQISDTASFCTQCGKPARTPSAPAAPRFTNAFPCEPYWGNETAFSLSDATIIVDPSMDAFNFYRKQFSQFARIKADELRAEYCARIKDLDSFLLYFPQIYQKHRKPLINAAMDVICKSEIYDISPEDFENQHTEDFCLCSEDVNTIVESFNLTIEANQDKKARMYNMIPGVIFSGGIGAFAAAFALNAAVSTIAENDIKNANVSKKQRAELYARINLNKLMERAYIDYWRVFLSLTYVLNQRGFAIWYPTDESNTRANGLYQNLAAGRIPQDKIASQTANLLRLNPYADEYLDYMKKQFGINPETDEIIKYFSI